MVHKNAEHYEQVALHELLDMHRIVHFSVPNAAKRSYALMSFLKAEGFRAGVADLVIMSDPHCVGAMFPRPVFLELKTKERKKEKDGGCSEAQMLFAKDCEELGYTYVVAYGFDNAVEILKGLGYGL